METPNQAVRSLRGFASMSKERQREIASRGGRAAHEKGTAHEFSPTEASQAARIGHQRGTAHEFTVDEARNAGRKGGLARARNRADNPMEQFVDAVNSNRETEMQTVGSSSMG